MNIEDEKRKYASQIVNALSGSPAVNKEQAEDLSIQRNDAADKIIDVLNANKPQPVYSGKEIFGAPYAQRLQQALDEASQPVDTSTGFDIPEHDTATQKIATTRTLGIEGAHDYEQRVYGLDEQSMASASSGINEDDLHVVNLRAGNAGLNVSTDSVLNPMDGSNGNPAFFNKKYPLLQTRVMPFKVKIPAYNLEVTSETQDPDKLAYQIATMIGGKPIPTYIGYTNAGFDLSESWYSGMLKSAMNIPIDLADLGVKGGAFTGTMLSHIDARNEMIKDVVFRGRTIDEAGKRLMENLEGINRITDETLDDWQKVVDGYKDYLGTDLTEYAGFWTSFAYGLPTALAQMGAAYGINVLASAGGVSPQASRLIAMALSGTTYGLAQGGDTFAGLKGVPISAAHRMRNSMISAGGSTLLNSLGYLGVFANKISAARQYSTKYIRRLWSAGATGAAKGFVSEGATEVGDQVLQDIMTYNMGDDTIANRLDNYALTFLVAGVTGLVGGIPSSVSEERAQIYMEQIAKGKLAADAPLVFQRLNDAVDKMSETRLLTREQVLDLATEMASPEGQNALRQKEGETMMGMLDKLNPNAVKYANSLSKKELERAAKDWEKLDRDVMKALPVDLDDSTKVMISRAMRLIAPAIVGNGGKFKMPKFMIRDDAPMAYDYKNNIIYINTKSTGESIDIGMVQDKNLRLLDPVQRGILHELGHMMDYQIGRGTNFKEFMPAYFEAIAKVFGKDKADRIKSNMAKSGNRFEFADSSKKADVVEKAQNKAKGEISEKNTTEYFAYAVARLGKKVGKALGLSDGDIAQHVDAIQILASGLKIPSIQKQLSAYQKALGELIKKNDATLIGMAKAQGEEGLARKIEDFVAGDDTALSKEDVLALYKILKTYVGVDGAKILDDAFQNVKPETFMERTEREFADSIKEQNMTVGTVQKGIEKANQKAMQDNKGKQQDQITNDDLPTFYNESTEVNEEVDTWHGTPHIFDFFKTLGTAHTGEGGNTHGWGVYLTTLKDRAKHYWHDVALKMNKVPIVLNITYKNGETRTIDIQNNRLLFDIFDGLQEQGYRLTGDTTWYDGYNLLDEYGLINAEDEVMEYNISHLLSEAYADGDDVKSAVLKINGNFGQVLKTVTPDTDTMLNAEKYNSEQNDYIKRRMNFLRPSTEKGLRNYYKNKYPNMSDSEIEENVKDEMEHWYDNGYGEDAYNVMSRAFGSQEGASRHLSANGINGIEYKGGQDGRSFVVFDPETIKILDIYRNTQDIEVLEETFDVSTILGDQKKKYVSTLEKRTTQKPDGFTYDADVKEVKKIMSESGKSPKWFTKFFANGDVTMGLWAMGGKKLVDHFDLIGKMNRSSNASMDAMLDFDGKLKKTMGFKSNIERDAFENLASIESIDVNGLIDPLTDDRYDTKLSPLVIMNLYNTAKNSKTRGKVVNTFDGNVAEMERVFNQLTPEQRKYADAMVEYIKDNWTYYKQSYEQEGIEIDDEPYWPVADAVHTAMGDRRINSEYARKPDTNGMISTDVDAREVFNHYIQRVTGGKEHVYSTIQRMKDLFGYERTSGYDNPTNEVQELSNKMWDESKKIRGLAVRNLGDDGKYQRFLELLDDFLAKREASLVGTESLNIAARNLTGGLLQWKPIQFMKNLANASGYWGLVPDGYQNEYWKYTAWAATHPIEAAKYMFEKVPYIRNRFKGQNIDEALTQQTAGQDSLLMNWAKSTTRLNPESQKVVSNIVALTQASRRLGYTPMLSGDMSANVVGGYGLLKIYEQQYGEHAGDKLSEDIVMHQASNNQATRSLLQRQWSRDIRGELLRFGSEGVQKGKSIGLAIAQAVRGERTSLSATKEILSTMSSMILFALISAGVIDLFDSDEENDKEVYDALTREGISAVAGFSVVGNSVIAPILSIPFTGKMSTIGTPLTNIVSADLGKLSKGDWTDLTVDGISATVPLVGLDNLINMGRGGYRTVAGGTPEEQRAGLYQVMGRTENYANKRAGVQKETVEKNKEE